jgi:hypothetical protein
VILIAATFFFRSRIDLWIKNLPGWERTDNEDIEIVPNDLSINICPEGYEIVGRFAGSDDTYYLYMNISGEWKKTTNEWIFRNNKIIIDKWGWFRELNLGSNSRIDQNKRKIEVSKEVFIRESDKFNEVLKKELETGEELFKYLLLIDQAVVKGISGPNYLCQNSSRISEENMRKALNKIYWGVEEPKIIDLTSERLIEDDYKTEGFYKINLERGIKKTFGTIEYYNSTEDGTARIERLKNVGTYIKREGERIFLFLFSTNEFIPEEKIYPYLIGEITEDGRVTIFCNERV